MLPFDLRMRRVIPYESRECTESRSSDRNRLQAGLEVALRSILRDAETVNEAAVQSSLADQLRTAAEQQSRGRISLARRYMADVVARLDGINPKLVESPDIDEQLVVALNLSVQVVEEFGKLVNDLAALDATDVIAALVEGFSAVLDRYDTRKGFSGHFLNVDFDFFKFLGHELFVTLVAPFVSERRWDVLSQLLDIELCVEKMLSTGTTGMLPHEKLSASVKLLYHRNNRLQWSMVSPHGFVLSQRHSEGPLCSVTPLDQFVDADLFLFLRSRQHESFSGSHPEWIPWSATYLGDRVPRFLAEAERKTAAQKLAAGLSTTSVAELQAKLGERIQELHKLFPHSASYSPLSRIDLAKIGSR